VHITTNLVRSITAHVDVYSIQPLVIKFVPDIPVSSTNKTERHGVTELVLNVALNTITLTP